METATPAKQPPDAIQSPNGTPPVRQDSRELRAAKIPANAEIHAALDTPLSSKTSRAGDRFTATLSQPIRGTSGADLIPAGSKLTGEIADNASRTPSQLLLRFSEITLPTGQKVPISSSVSMGGDGKEVNLPAQTPLVLKLERPVTVPAYQEQ